MQMIPKARREAVREIVFGLAIEDPYRWLEDDSPEALEWGSAQDAIARSYLAEWPHYETVRKQLANSGYVWPSLEYGGPQPCGERWVWPVPRRKQYPRLMMSDEPFGQGEIIFDPDRLAEGEPCALRSFQVSPDNRFVVVSLEYKYESRPGHAAAMFGPCSVRLIDVETSQLLDDSPPARGAGSGAGALGWMPDGSGFYYPGFTAEGVSGVFFHRLGDASDEMEIEGVSASWVKVSADGHYAAAGGNRNGISNLPRAEYMKDLRVGGPWRPFLSHVDGRCDGFFVGDAYVALTTEGADKGRVVSIPIATPDERSSWRELVPEGDKVITCVSKAQDRLVVARVDHIGAELSLYSFDGTPTGIVPLPPGTPSYRHETVGTVDPTPAGFSFMHGPTRTGLPSLYEFDLKSGQLRQWPPPTPGLGELHELRVESSGPTGLRCPIQLVCRPEVDLSRPNPILIAGYGNLNRYVLEHTTPAWFLPFLDAGGVYAWVTLPGDGNFGLEYYRKGSGANKIVPLLSFIAATEHLIEEGFTDRERVAIMGCSGGAMLMMNALCRRPDLFRAVIAYGGLSDFLRIAKNAPFVWNEWGDPSDPKGTAEWSAYQNVRDGERYPSVLIAITEPEGGWVGDNRKMVAALQHANSSANPILFRNFKLYGHTDPGAITGESGPDSGNAMVDFTAFIMRELGMTP